MLLSIELDTRLIYLTGDTSNPVGEWVTQQACNLSCSLTEQGRSRKFLIRDRDTKFTSSFDEVFRADGIRIIKTPVRSPRANAIAKRFVGTIRRECTEWVLIFGRAHLEQMLAAYLAHDNDHRPHRSLDQRAPMNLRVAPDPIDSPRSDTATPKAVLDGLVHE